MNRAANHHHLPATVRAAGQRTAVLWLCAAVLLLGGCSTPCFYGSSGTAKITAEADANEFSATAVDVVVALDDALANQLAVLKAREYFSARAQLQRDFPATMVVKGWEITPGQTLEKGALDYACDTVAVYVFASYGSKGGHRVRLAKNGDFSVLLRNYDFEVTE